VDTYGLPNIRLLDFGQVQTERIFRGLVLNVQRLAIRVIYMWNRFVRAVPDLIESKITQNTEEPALQVALGRRRSESLSARR
jgi:hypothetical protein